MLATTILLCVLTAPIPDAAAQTRALALINEVYGAKIKAADTVQAKAALAQEILQLAAKETDPASKYVAIQTARRLATDAGNNKLVLEAIRQFVAAFDPPGPPEAKKTQADWLAAAEKFWDEAEDEKEPQKTARRLRAAEAWFRAGSRSAILAEKWAKRLEMIRSGADIVLRARDARLVGTQLVYSKRIDATQAWIDPQEYPEWQLKLATGDYSVSMEYAADGNMAPDSVFQLQVINRRARKPISRGVFTLKRTGAWPTFATVTIGSFTIHTETEYFVRLLVLRKSTRTPRGIINLRAMRLTRQSS